MAHQLNTSKLNISSIADHPSLKQSDQRFAGTEQEQHKNEESRRSVPALHIHVAVESKKRGERKLKSSFSFPTHLNVSLCV